MIRNVCEEIKSVKSVYMCTFILFEIISKLEINRLHEIPI